MRVQIITNANGFGMTQDVAVVREVLAEIGGDSIEVVYNHWEKPKAVPRGQYDLNIFGEFLNPAFYAQAKRNVFVPNPEWFWQKQHLHGVDQVWAKTHDTERIFTSHRQHSSGLRYEVRYTGWTSTDCLDPTVERKKVMVHLAGASSAKGTKEVIKAMSVLPEFELLIISQKNWGPLPKNVQQLHWLEPGEFNRIRNEAMVHLCPSSYEGFGHYLNEARAVGAAIITTNAPPMNELVLPSFGFGASVASHSHQNMGTHSHVDVGSLIDRIQLAMSQPENVLRMLGGKARAAYIADREAFTTRIQALL